MIMEAVLILTLVFPSTGYAQNPARMSTTSQMFSTMEACHRTKHRLEILYNRQSGAIREYAATVICVDAR
jgi:hypothetical protein